MTTEGKKVYKKANVPLVGTYKQYSSKNTNAGLDWKYIQLSPEFVLYFTKDTLCGFVYKDKAIARISWSVRSNWEVSQLVTRHQMRVIASQTGDELIDDGDMRIAQEHWLLNCSFDASRMPHLLREVMERGELSNDLVMEIARADYQQFA